MHRCLDGKTKKVKENKEIGFEMMADQKGNERKQLVKN